MTAPTSSYSCNIHEAKSFFTYLLVFNVHRSVRTFKQIVDTFVCREYECSSYLGALPKFPWTRRNILVSHPCSTSHSAILLIKVITASLKAIANSFSSLLCQLRKASPSKTSHSHTATVIRGPAGGPESLGGGGKGVLTGGCPQSLGEAFAICLSLRGGV